jgi:hypothetical protein
VSGRRNLIDYAAVGFVVLIVAVLLWPSFSSDGEPDTEPDQAADVLETPEPTSTPEPEPTSTPEPGEEFAYQCVPFDANQMLSDFIWSFNTGDWESLAAMLPLAGAESPLSSVYPRIDQQMLQRFRMHGFGATTSRAAILSHLAERYEAGEYWHLKEFSRTRIFADPRWGNPHLDDRYATIQRTAPDFPTHDVRGRAVINCVDELIVFWDFETDDPDIAEPIPIDAFLETLEPYDIGQHRFLRLHVQMGERADGGALTEWQLRRNEATSYEGNFVERAEIVNPDRETEIEFVFDGLGWYLNQRGWRANGMMVSAPSLPLEIMLTRREPSITGELVRQYVESSWEMEDSVLHGELTEHPDVLVSLGNALGVELSAGEIEVEIEGGAVRQTVYRLVDADGVALEPVTIRWVELGREDHYRPSLFEHFQGPIRFQAQYKPPDTLPSDMRFADEPVDVEMFRVTWQIEWGDVLFSLAVMPSRGGIGPLARGDNWDPDWPVTREVHRGQLLALADADQAGRPTHAVWDTGEHRFEVRVVEPPGDVLQGAPTIRAVVDVLSGHTINDWRPATDRAILGPPEQRTSQEINSVAES